MQLDFSGKSAVITGATSGIGTATAGLMAESGCQVVITGRNRERLTALAEALNKKGARVCALAGDICDGAFRRQLIEQSLSDFGRLDILVNNAGIIAMDRSDDQQMETYDSLMDVNLRSVVALTQLAIPHLVSVGGNIVNVSSVAGCRAFPGIMSYCISKAGLDQFTRCAALELAPHQVRVNAVNPGVVETRLHINSGMSSEAYADFLAHSATTHPLGRAGQPEEVANLIVFLASGAAGWITGGTFSIDGGRAQTCLR